MKWNRLAIALCIWGILAAAGHAQTFGGTPRPAVSPYLNLNRGGNPAINYYGLVRPHFAAAKAFETLGAEFNTLEASTNQLVQTGNRSSFMTQGRYFMNNGMPRQTGSGAPATPQRTQNPAPRTR